LLGFVSSTISMVYSNVSTSFAGTVNVAVIAEASIPLATTRPLLGLIAEPCCSLIVTVPLDGFVHVIVVGCPAVTSRVLP